MPKKEGIKKRMRFHIPDARYLMAAAKMTRLAAGKVKQTPPGLNKAIDNIK